MDQQQTIERYILNRMDEEEASEFEAYYLGNKECLEQLQLAEKLHLGLRHAEKSATPGIATTFAAHRASNDQSWWQRGLPVWSAAALLMLALIPSGYFYQQAQQLGGPQAGLAVINVPLSETRSATGNNEIVIEPSGNRIVLSIYVDTSVDRLLFSNYGFSLTGAQDTEPSWQTDNLQLNANSVLYVDLGRNYLQAGNYRYRIFGIEDNASTLVSEGEIVVN